MIPSFQERSVVVEDEVAVEEVEEEVDRVDLGRDVENNLQELKTTSRNVLDLIVMRQLVLQNIFLLTNSKYTPVCNFSVSIKGMLLSKVLTCMKFFLYKQKYIFLPEICTFGRKYFYILSNNCSSCSCKCLSLKFTERVTI